MTDRATPEIFLIGLAALELLSEAGAESPLLVAADDAHWLDGPTASVLTFIARRLALEQIALVAAIREGIAGPFDDADLEELSIEPLSPEAAARALDRRAPDMEPAMRHQVLDQARGNPLALAELPLALAGSGSLVQLSEEPPPTARLESAFSARAADLPEKTRTLLLVAALDDSGALGEILSAAGLATGADPALEDLQPAIAAGLVEVTQAELRFSHPLVRSAIRQTATRAERRAAHLALAEVLADAPDRRVWHSAPQPLAAARTGC